MFNFRLQGDTTTYSHIYQAFFAKFPNFLLNFYENGEEMMDFYQNLKRLCLEHGVSMSTALTAAGVDRSAVTRWKNGERPNARNINKIAAYFNMTAAELMEILWPTPKEEPTPAAATESEMDLLTAYRNAPANIQGAINLMLQPYAIKKAI